MAETINFNADTIGAVPKWGNGARVRVKVAFTAIGGRATALTVS